MVGQWPDLIDPAHRIRRGPAHRIRRGVAHRRSRCRASATVTTDPVTRMPTPLSAPSTSASARGDGEFDRVRHLRAYVHPILAEDLDGVGELGGHRPRRRVPGHHDLVEDRFEQFEYALDVLVGQDDTMPTSVPKLNSSCSAVTVAAMPCGLCAASSRIVGELRMRSSRPGEWRRRTRRGSPRCRAAADPRRRGTPRPRRGPRRVLRLVRAVQWNEDLVVVAVEALNREHLAADRERPRDEPEVDALARSVAPTSAHRCASRGAHPPPGSRRSRWRRRG